VVRPRPGMLINMQFNGNSFRWLLRTLRSTRWAL